MGFYVYVSSSVLLHGIRFHLGESSIFVYSRSHFHHQRACQAWNEIAFTVYGPIFSSDRLFLAAWPAYPSVSETCGSELLFVAGPSYYFVSEARGCLR